VSEQQPAWPGQPQPQPQPQPPAARRRLDLKLVIAVLIGLVSVTGAVVAWRAAQLGEFATDKDRQAIAETVVQEQNAADNEVTVQDARGRVAAHAAAVVAAEQLEAEAAETGDPEDALDAAEEAAEQRAIAERYLQSGPTNLLLADYVVTDPESGRVTLDEGRLRADLRALSDAQSQVDPSQTVREANRLRDESQHFDGWLVPMVFAVFLLTIAQISRTQLPRVAFAGVAMVVWIASTVLAFGGAS
jgi:hypothetical protein